MKKVLLTVSVLAMLAGTAAADAKLPFTANAPADGIAAYDGSVNRTWSSPSMFANTRAEESMIFSYAGDVETAWRFQNLDKKATVWLGFAINKEDLQEMVGRRITGLQYTGGVSSANQTVSTVREITIQLFKKLGDAPVYEQTSPVENKAFNSELVPFTTPYEITEADGPLYVTYRFTLIRQSNPIYYVPSDGNTSAQSTACMVAWELFDSNKPATYPAADKWGTYAREYGALACGIQLTGDNLPHDMASVRDLVLPISATAGGTSEAAVTISNKAANAVSSVELEFKGADSQPYVTTVNLDTPLGNNRSTDVKVSGIKIGDAGFKNVTVSVTKVNGQPNGLVGNSTAASFYVLDEGAGYDRNLVVEEATGTWCGYCPSGIVMMEWLKETYPERVMRIGVHCSQSANGSEPMEISSYLNFIYTYVNGFPSAMLNRTYQLAPTTWPNVKNNVTEIYDYLTSSKTYCNTTLSGTVAEDDKSVEIVSDTEFAFDAEGIYQLAFAVVEDGVGPYDQNNYYAGSGSQMGGWQNKGETVSTIFDDVARYLSGFPADKGSLPAEIKKGVSYQYKVTLPLNKVAGGKFRVIGMIVNTTNGEIMNATRASFVKTGVKETELGSQNVTVTAGYGNISIEGAGNAAVYTLAGAKVADGSASGLAAGVYVVLADGKSYKVLVK